MRNTMTAAAAIAVVALVWTSWGGDRARGQDSKSVLISPKGEPTATSSVAQAPSSQPSAPRSPTISPPILPQTQPGQSSTTAAQPQAQSGQPRQQVIDESKPANTNPNELPAPTDAVRKAPPIVYDTDSDARRMYACYGSIELIMVTCNPADGCHYEIPLCVPGCCTGAPSVVHRRGLFGRGVVEYCWPCGFEAIVKFRNIGDVRVDYEGD